MTEREEPALRGGGLAPGSTVGAYRIERVLGSGGAGTVYLAEETTKERRVALKVLRLGPEHESVAGRARLEREARAANEVRHPGIVEVESIGHLPDGRPYLVLPFLEGKTLREEIAVEGAMPPREAWRVARELALALGAAHRAGVVHRDLKPDNVFLEEADGGARVRVLDFGLAKFDPLTHGGNEAELVRALTRSEVTVGTPAYMAPEQWWNSGVGPGTDQYALGVVLFEMLAGRAPFDASSIAEVVQAHLHGVVPTLEDRGAPSGTDALLARALAKSSDDRFPDLDALVAAGDAVFGVPEARHVSAEVGVSPAASVDLSSPRVPRAVPAHVASAGLVLVVVVLVGYAGAARHDPRAWVMLGGAPQLVTLLVFALGLVLLPWASRRRSSALAMSLALLPAVLGELGTFTDWAMVESVLPKFPDKLAAVHEGMYEANLARFLGGALSVALLTSFGALVGLGTYRGDERAVLRARPDPAARVDLALGAVLLFVVTPAAAWLGAPSAAWIALVAAVPLARAGAFARFTDRATPAVRFVVEALPIVLALAVGFARIEAREAYLWTTGATRAERAAEIVAAASERRLTALLAVAVLALVAYPMGRRARAALRAPSRRAVVLLAVMTSCVLLDVGLRARVSRVVDDLRHALEPEFTLYAHLDPPLGDRLDAATHRPHAAPAVQLARGAIAVNAKGVAPVAALRSTEGALVVGAEIHRALAAAVADAPTKSAPDAVDLAIVVDREARYADVRRILELAASAGVVRVELLLTRGAAPVLDEGGPPEAAYVLEGDFVALPAVLDPAGASPDPAASFERVAPDLVDVVARGGVVRLAYGH